MKAFFSCMSLLFDDSSLCKVDIKLANTDIIDQMDLANIYRILYPNTAEYLFFSAAHGTFSKAFHTLKIHKEHLNKHGKTKMPNCILSNHKETKP